MMATEIIKIDASWAEKWTKTGVPFLSAPTVGFRIHISYSTRRRGGYKKILYGPLTFCSGPSTEDHVLKQSILLHLSRPSVDCLQTGARRTKVPG